jgi:hypothetical protein
MRCSVRCHVTSCGTLCSCVEDTTPLWRSIAAQTFKDVLITGSSQPEAHARRSRTRQLARQTRLAHHLEGDVRKIERASLVRQ